MPAREGLTPGQLAKQRQVVRAAMRVLLKGGVAGCTAREVAAAGPLTKSAIHYYFADMDVLIDRAMSEHVSVFVHRMAAAAAVPRDPMTQFWAAVDAYLSGFTTSPAVTYLWFEYWVQASRRGHLEVVVEMKGRITALLTERLEAADVSAATEVAESVFSYLTGAVISRSPAATDLDKLRADVATLTGIAIS